jgi:hypothetical protein
MSDNLPALVDYSKALAASDLLPAEYRGKPANVLVAIEYGKALDLAPMAAIQGITVIKGKPTASAALMAGLVRRAGHILRVSGNDKRAECTIIRNDDPDFEFTAIWTIDRAKTAGLLSNPTWSKYPDAMLKARAISECARNACSEILAGVQYTAEELGADEPVAPTTAQRTTAVRTRAVTSTVPTAERVTVAEPDFDEPAPVKAEPEIVDAEVIEDEPEPTPKPAGDPITQAQLKALHATLNGMGLKDRGAGHTMLGRLIGRPIETTNDLTKSEASHIIDTLKKELDG